MTEPRAEGANRTQDGESSGGLAAAPYIQLTQIRVPLEQEERHALEQRRQADREQLDWQRVTATRGLLDLEAANESPRLQRLDERIKAYPDAALNDLDTTRLGVARALAGNSRTMLHIGAPGDIALAIFPPEERPEPVEAPKDAPAGRRRG